MKHMLKQALKKKNANFKKNLLHNKNNLTKRINKFNLFLQVTLQKLKKRMQNKNQNKKINRKIRKNNPLKKLKLKSQKQTNLAGNMTTTETTPIQTAHIMTNKATITTKKEISLIKMAF